MRVSDDVVNRILELGETTARLAIDDVVGAGGNRPLLHNCRCGRIVDVLILSGERWDATQPRTLQK